MSSMEIQVHPAQNSSPFAVRAVIEGFYGVFYTFPERNNLIRFAAAHGFNRYIYAPKNDRQHRNRWQESYPRKIMAQFAETTRIARQAGISFSYAIAPGVSMAYSSQDDFDRITTKLLVFYGCGVRDFSILLDDIAPEFRHEEDRHRYRTYAEAHTDLCNRLYAWLKRLDPVCTLSMCPTEYYGSAPFSSYLYELGERLNPAIDIFYSGPEICAPSISTEDVDAFASFARRKPILWDNYPVNDLRMRSELHIGPIRHRDADLADHVKGIAVNLMIQAEASKIPLLTYADYLNNPQGYQPEQSWREAIEAIAGKENSPYLMRLAENSLHSCLGTVEAERLEVLTDRALAALQNGEKANSSLAVRNLDDYLTSLDEACYHLLNRMDNLALRANLIPWIEQLDNWTQLARNAIRVLTALENGESIQTPLYFLNDYLEAAQTNPKRIAGEILLPLAQFVYQPIEASKELVVYKPPAI